MENTTSRLAEIHENRPHEVEHTWDQKPHTVSRGAEKNFVEFMAELSSNDLQFRMIRDGVLSGV